MRLQCLLCEPELDELLLLHELGVRTVVDNIAAEYWYSERTVNLFSVDVLELSVEDEIVAVEAKVAGHLPAEQGEGEYVTVLVLD